MLRSAVTVNLVSEAKTGPFVYFGDLAGSCASAAALGFEAVEIFAPSPAAVDVSELTGLLEQHQLKVAAVGTGAGMVLHGLSLTDPSPTKRDDAKDFIRRMIDFGARFGAPAIIGSMQGRWGGSIDRNAALSLLAEALEELGTHAKQYGLPLLYEPLNRYETNLFNTLAGGVSLLGSLSTDNVKLLADLFHMNIEEANLADSIRTAADHIGHVHFVDSNRQAAGFGHLDFAPIISALKHMGYTGYLSAEAFGLPDSQTAAARTIATFREFCRQ